MTAEDLISNGAPVEIAEDYLMEQGVQPEFARAQYAHPYVIGEAYLIRSVTFTYLGRVVAVTGQEVVLEEAAWVPETGRFNECFLTGETEELEPYPDGQVILGRAAIVDAARWPKKIVRTAK